MKVKVLLGCAYEELSIDFITEFYKTFKKDSVVYNILTDSREYDSTYGYKKDGSIKVVKFDEKILAEFKNEAFASRTCDKIYFFDKKLCSLNDDLDLINTKCHCSSLMNNIFTYDVNLIHNKETNTYHDIYISFVKYYSLEMLEHPDVKKLISIIEKMGIKNVFTKYSEYASIVEFDPIYDFKIIGSEYSKKEFVISIPYAQIIEEISNKDGIGFSRMHPLTQKIVSGEKPIRQLEAEMKIVEINK